MLQYGGPWANGASKACMSLCKYSVFMSCLLRVLLLAVLVPVARAVDLLIKDLLYCITNNLSGRLLAKCMFCVLPTQPNFKLQWNEAFYSIPQNFKK